MAGKSTSLVIEVITDSSKASKGLDQVAQKTDGLASGLTKKLGGLALGAGILKFGTDSIKAAAQAEQAVGGVAAVFKGQSSQIEKAAQGAAKSIGLSTSSYEQMATVMGSQLKTAGFDDVAGKTEELIGLGADLAAMYGGTTADAVSAISGVLKGERDAIEKYGISMNQAAVDAEILALGLDTSTASAKQQATAQASLSLLYKQSADAQGAAAREQDSASARYQQFTATLENLEAAVGSALLPALSALMELAMQAAPAIQGIGEAVSGTLAFILNLPGPILAAGTALGALVLLKGPLGGIAEGISNLFANVAARQSVMMEGGQKVGFFGAAVKEAGRGLKGFGSSLMGAFGGPWGLAISGAILGITTLVSLFSDGEAEANDFGSAIDDATGKLSVLKTIEALSPETVDLLHAAGINASEYATALAQGGGAADLFRTKLEGIKSSDTSQGLMDTGESFDIVGEKGKAAGDLLDQFGVDGEAATNAVADAADKASVSTDKAATSIEGMGAAAQIAAAKTDAMNKLLSDPQGLAQAAVDATEMSTTLAGFARNAETASREAQLFSITLGNVSGQSRAVTDTQLGWADAMREVNSLHQENGAALSLSADAMAQFNISQLAATDDGAQFVKTMLGTKDAYLEQVSAAYSAAEATGGVTAAQDAGKKTADDLRTAFINQAKQMGLNDTQAANLADQIGILDGQKVADKNFDILADNSDATKKLNDIIQMKILDKTATVIVNDLASAGIAKINSTTVDPKTGLVTVNYDDHKWVQYTPEGKRATITIGFNYPSNYNPVTGTVDRQRAAAPQLATFGMDPSTDQPGITAFGASSLGSSLPTITVPLVIRPQTAAVASKPTVYNYRYDITINGAVDKDGTARELKKLLQSRERRTGAVSI